MMESFDGDLSPLSNKQLQRESTTETAKEEKVSWTYFIEENNPKNSEVSERSQNILFSMKYKTKKTKMNPLWQFF